MVRELQQQTTELIYYASVDYTTLAITRYTAKKELFRVFESNFKFCEII
jgi:hypothetical protein